MLVVTRNAKRQVCRWLHGLEDNSGVWLNLMELFFKVSSLNLLKLLLKILNLILPCPSRSKKF